jgi:hypothetical protein
MVINVSDSELENLNRLGNFILKRVDGHVEAYTGYLIGISPTHFKIRLLDDRELSMLRGDVFKIEWLKQKEENKHDNV